MIKNLAQLKRRFSAGTEFKIVGHCRPEAVGERRRVTAANTQGFYSIIPDDLDAKTSKANGGRGAVLWWSKAPFWSFENGVCAIYDSDREHTGEHLIMAFQVDEEGDL